jgi:glycosyltransferase involved in cell wall biosynthesis
MVTTPLKIVIAGPHGSSGGLEIHTSELERFLVSQGHHVLRVNVINHNKLSHFPRDQIFITNSPGFRGKLNKSIDWFLASLACRKFAPDLLVSTAIGFGYTLLARLVGSRVFRIIQVVTDDYPSNDAGMLRLVHAHNAVAAQTALLKTQFMLKISPNVPAHVLPCFHQIDSSIYQFKPNVTPLSQPRLAYFGRLVGNKGIPFLLDAWSRLDILPLPSLDIWGSGELKAELDNIIRKSPLLSSCVTLKGPYPNGLEYVNILSSYNGLVLPSQSTEGLPLVLLEAASVGLPILTTRVGGIPDFANSNPDVVMVEVGQDALRLGLKYFLNHIQRGTKFSRSRHISLFLSQYSRPAIESVWLRMLDNPSMFFSERTAL